MLQASRGGAAVEMDQMLLVVYQELRALAQRQLERENAAHTLQPTALVHEVYLRMVDQELATVEDRAHFRSLCARVMRQVLVDHARRIRASKRGGGRPVQLETVLVPADGDAAAGLDLLALDEAMDRLAALDARKARVVELRIFSGLSVAETAEALGVSDRTVEADWFFARAWLRGELDPET